MSEPALPTLAVDGALDEALRPGRLRELGAVGWTRFFLERRWFGAKGRPPSDVRILDVVPSWPGTAVARFELDVGGSRPLRYQVPLAVRARAAAAEATEDERPRASGGSGEAAAGESPKAVAAVVRSATAGEGLLFDATEDAAFRRGLGAAFDRPEGATFGDGAVRWRIAPLPGREGTVAPREAGRVGSAEQSNTSILYGDRAILKLYRRLEPGENPDVEIGEFLATRTSFRGVPELLGTIRFEEAGAPTVAGMLQRFVSSVGDGWKHALRCLDEDLAPGAGRPSFPAEAERLGAVTRGLHEALASDGSFDAFAPLRAERDDLEEWRRATVAQAEQALDLLAERAEALPADVAEHARALLARRPAVRERIDGIVGGLGDSLGLKIRHHGDYHLGQVLRTEVGDFAIIDFEGEPARPLEERRRKQCPLRDVAGMLRSFAYAAATGAARAAERGAGPGVERRAGDWEEAVRLAFLAGYGRPGTVREHGETPAPGAAGAIDLLPAGEGLGRVTLLFEVEKAFYELAYELQNRPGWVAIPLAGIGRLLAAG